MLKHLTVAQVNKIIAEADKLAAKYSPSKARISLNDPSLLADIEAYDNDSEALTNAIREVSPDAMVELKALMWLGRGDFGEFGDALAEAHDQPGGDDAIYIAEKSPLADYLREGLRSL